MQPRLGSGGSGKSNDDIVYELADSILEKLMDKLDLEAGKQEMFEVGTFFLQCIDKVYLI